MNGTNQKSHFGKVSYIIILLGWRYAVDMIKHHLVKILPINIYIIPTQYNSLNSISESFLKH